MRFLVIEGLDGSGKSTQVELLRNYLDERAVKYKYLHFPRLEEGVYGSLIARFLRGEMGDISQVDPYLVALIFAGDRLDAKAMLEKWMKEDYLVIVDRFVYSNIAFQCAKQASLDEQKKLADWIIDLGPEGGSGGGEIVAQGTPEQVAQTPQSHTGHYLKKYLQP